MSVKFSIFLDDSRNPSEVFWIEHDYSATNWIIVRNYEQFVDVINSHDFDIVSLDHDLDESSTYECIRSSSNKCDFDYSRVKQKTGLDCAKYLKKWCEDNDKDIPNYLVHSLNPNGANNIIKFLGPEKLIAEKKSQLHFQKADEILKRRIKR